MGTGSDESLMPFGTVRNLDGSYGRPKLGLAIQAALGTSMGERADITMLHTLCQHYDLFHKRNSGLFRDRPS